MKKTVLITGAAGFVGASLSKRLLGEGEWKVVGVDNMNSYYDVSLKQYRLSCIEATGGDWTFCKGDIADGGFVSDIFLQYKPSVVVNLAAQAGVRYSLVNPDAYISSNLVGFFNILEACRHFPVEHLVFASSSSVYGNNSKVPYSVDDMTDAPVSLYAATKKSNELMAHAYSSLYGIPSTGLRFFTVYGPAGRPDMAYFSFTDKLVRGEGIKLFNYGKLSRDFTYIDDIVEGVRRVMGKAPEADIPFKIYNIGGQRPVELLFFVDTLHKALVAEGLLPEDYDIHKKIEFVPMQPGDVLSTCADTSALEKDFGFRPAVALEDGLGRFARWYSNYYNSDV